MKRLFLTLVVLICLAGRASAAPEPAAPPAPLNVNTATEEELIQLPGIGPAKATAILAQRKKVGGFKRLEDVLRARGIGRKLLARLRPFITVAPP
jgi:competence protein ComEA